MTYKVDAPNEDMAKAYALVSAEGRAPSPVQDLCTFLNKDIKVEAITELPE